MMATTLQLKALYDRFDDFISGRVPMTTYEAAEFKRSLRTVMAQVGLLELGVDTARLDVLIQASTPGSNIVDFGKRKLDRIAARATEGEPL